jgi:signal transduction histidine kinase/ligand-binding sensor domain-containing protein
LNRQKGSYLLRRFRLGLPAVGVLFFAAQFSIAQTNTSWFIRNWQSGDGLPNNTVLDLAQTPDGFLWVATPIGIARFDGHQFDQFSPIDFAGEQNGNVSALAVNHKGGLVVAMNRGDIVRLSPGSQEIFRLPLDVPTRIPEDALEDGEGTIWIACHGGGIYSIKNGVVTFINESRGLAAGQSVPELALDNQGRVWFCKNGQFGHVQDGLFQTDKQFERVPACLAAARDGGIWICSGGHLFKYKSRVPLLDFGTFGSSAVEPRAMLEDHVGAVWIGTSYSGLFRFDGAGFQPIATPHPLISSLLEDRDGDIWAGTGGGGLNQIRPRAVELERSEAGLPFEIVQSLCQDSIGKIWAAALNGLLAYRTGGRWETAPPGANWPNDASCLAADASGTIWVGTIHRRILCSRDGSFAVWGNTNDIKGHAIHALLAARNGDLWIGEQNPNALQRLRAGELKDFALPADIRSIRAIAEDTASNIWVGTSKGTLLKVTGDALTDETSRTMNTPASIRCLAATPDGSVWIGYASAGLGRLKNGTMTRYIQEQGLFDNAISQIVADDQGWLWFGSDHGIFKARQADFDAVTSGHAARVRCIQYGRSEGLPDLQAYFGSAPGALRSRDGRLWIPTRSGLAVVNTDKIQENARPPEVLLTRVAVDEKLFAWYGGVLPTPKGAVNFEPQNQDVVMSLHPRYRQIEFDYTAMTFAGGENVQFRSKLDGFDEDWSVAGVQRNAKYPRLPAGRYHFHIQACNPDGVWNEPGVVLNFIVTPFFWQTWWFESVMAVIFAGCLIAVVRYVSFRRLRLRLQRAEQQAALHKERARIARDIHDDLGANLTQISLLGELARQDSAAPEKTEEHVQKISATARGAIKSLDEIVWAVNPRNDTLAQLADYAGQFALDYLQMAGIRCRLDIPDPLPDRELSTEVRHNLFLVVKESLNNVVKHAHAHEVNLRLSVTDDLLQIEIADNGNGVGEFTADAWPDGLKNMSQRMKDIGGEFTIEARNGSGTTVIARFPWSKEAKK